MAERSRAKNLSFKTAAEQLIESKRPGWRNAKHAAQWASTLDATSIPSSARSTSRRSTPRRLSTCSARSGPRRRDGQPGAPAHRGRARLRCGSGRQLRRQSGRWRGHLDHLLPQPKKVRKVKHHAALDWRELPGFMDELARREGVAAKALAFTILTAARSGEVRGMTWAEIDEGRRLDCAGWPHQGRQGTSRSAHPGGEGASWRPWPPGGLVFPARPTPPGRCPT